MNDKAEVNIKQRIVGAIVLVSLGIIVIPMLLDGEKDQQQNISNSNIPVLPSHLDKKIAPVASPKPRYQPRPVSVRPIDELTDTSMSETDTAKADKAKMPGEQAASQAKKSQAPQQQSLKPEANTMQNNQAASKNTSAALNYGTASKPKTSRIESGFTIQVGSFGNKANAFSLRDKLRKDDYRAYIESVTITEGVRYRVRVGPFLKYDEAEDNRDKLKQQHHLNGTIVKYKT